MKEKIKFFFNSKILFLILGLFIGGTTCVFAVTYFPSNQVTYDNSTSTLKSTDVQGAIDELYSTCKECTSTSESSDNVYTLSSNGAVYKWDGSSFNSFGNPTSAGQFVGIATSGDNIYIMRENGAVYKWDGSRFKSFGNPTSAGQFVGIATSGDNIYIMSENGKVYKWNGSSFKSFGNPTRADQFVGVATG